MTATIQISSLSRLFFRAFFFLPPLGQKGTKRKDTFGSKKTPSRDFGRSGCFRARLFCEEEETTSSSAHSFLASRVFGASRRKLLFFLFFFAETAFLQCTTREKKIKNTRTQTDHASLKIIHFLDDDDDDEKNARSRIKPKQIWMFFLLVLVRFVLRDARSNEGEFSEIGNRVLGKSDEQFEPNRVVFGSSESEG